MLACEARRGEGFRELKLSRFALRYTCGQHPQLEPEESAIPCGRGPRLVVRTPLYKASKSYGLLYTLLTRLRACASRGGGNVMDLARSARHAVVG